jgi:Histidine phosphatase superfamily (branch 1)
MKANSQFGMRAGALRKTLLLAAGLCAFVASALTSGAQAGQGDIFETLRKGGYTLYFRHAQSDWRGAAAVAEKLPAKPDPCAGERLLSDEGRADARTLAIAFKSLNLKVSDVVAANLCRMQETARIAFGAPRTVNDLAARPGAALSLSAEAAAVERLARSPLPENGVRIIVGDYEVAQALFGVTLGEGDAVVLKTGADGKSEPVARIRLSDWRAMAPVASSAAVGQGTLR